MTGTNSIAAVDVAIVTFGGAGDLPACVAAVRAQGRLVRRVLVVDNASPDDTADVARSLSGVEVIAHDENTGYAAAMNEAFATTDAPYLLTLNADCALGPGYLDACVAAIEADPHLAGVTGVLTLPDGRIDSTGIALTRAAWASDRDRHREVGQATTRAPLGVSGAAALWRRAALLEAGPAPWWAWLFVYWDDVELGLRLGRRGWTFAVVPAARAVHRRGADSADPTFVEAHAYRNRLATLARHLGWRGVAAPGSLVVSVVSGLRLAVRHPAALRAAHPLAAVRAGLAARRLDGDLRPLDRSLLDRHPWRGWLRAQLGRSTPP